MDSTVINRLVYLPVIPEYDTKLLMHCRSLMLNSTRPVPSQHLELLKDKEIICCDSGGLQLFWALEKGKKIVVGLMRKTNVNNPNVFTLGIDPLCREYSRMNASMGLTVDYPSRCDDSDLVYFWKKSRSRKARDQMLKVAPYLCPQTELIIALQPRHPAEISSYFNSFYSPDVRTYAYPIRKFRNKPKDALGNAFVLSFLYHAGIRHVHFLGSSAPVVIFVLAQAIALGMFERASFDSRTWHETAFAGPGYLEPFPGKLGSIKLNSDDNLRTKLANYPGSFERILGHLDLPRWVIAEEWVDIYNIFAINDFKNEVLLKATTIGLKELILHELEMYEGQEHKILKALRLLADSMRYGHRYVLKYYSKYL